MDTYSGYFCKMERFIIAIQLYPFKACYPDVAAMDLLFRFLSGVIFSYEFGIAGSLKDYPCVLLWWGESYG